MSNQPKAIRVAHIINDQSLVLNVGKSDGIEVNQRFLIYGLGDEIADPATGESLGRLELVRGTGRVSYVQDAICIVVSDYSKNPFKIVTVLGGEPDPFDNPSVGDFARKI
jgi:hypothetical protein